MSEIELKIKKLYNDIELPVFKEGNAGIDVRAYFPEENNERVSKVVIKPNQVVKINTGLALDIPEGYFVMIAPRSSFGIKKNLSLSNTVAVIDESYKGEVLLFVRNDGDEDAVIEHNERIVQMLLLPTYKVAIKETEELSESERGAQGFGSSGKF